MISPSPTNLNNRKPKQVTHQILFRQACTQTIRPCNQDLEFHQNGPEELAKTMWEDDLSSNPTPTHPEANIGVLLATKEGVRLTVGPQTVELEAGQPLGFDFCQEAMGQET